MSAVIPALAVALSDGQMKIVIVLLAALAVGSIAAAAMMLFSRQDANVVERLERYGRPGSTAHEGADAMVETQLVQQAVDITGRLAERAGILEWLETSLEQSDLPIRAPEALFLYLAGVVGALLLFLILLSTIFAALFITVVVGAVPPLLLLRARSKRKKAFESQLPDTLQLLAGAMRSGFSLLQALEASATETNEPMKRELNRALTETRLGRSLEDSLDDCAARINSLDLSWAVMAIRIQREVGGNLAELLDNVSDTMAQRDRLRAEIKSLTAEGRYSGIILGLMPVVFGAMLYSFDAEFMKPLFATFTGICILAGTAILSGVGFLWIRKIMDIEV